METWTVRGGEAALPALETSLVEWKRVIQNAGPFVLIGLGNFLSGMETSIRPTIFFPEKYLGNFLSGMETTPESR